MPWGVQMNEISCAVRDLLKRDCEIAVAESGALSAKLGQSAYLSRHLRHRPDIASAVSSTV